MAIGSGLINASTSVIVCGLAVLAIVGLVEAAMDGLASVVDVLEPVVEPDTMRVAAGKSIAPPSEYEGECSYA